MDSFFFDLADALDVTWEGTWLLGKLNDGQTCLALEGDAAGLLASLDRQIQRYAGGDRPPSPPAWLLELRRRVAQQEAGHAL